MRRFLPPLPLPTLGALALAATAVQPLWAEVQVVETLGRAVATGVASDAELRRRALEQALYDAAMAGGAQVRGYSAIVGAQMQSERLVVQPASRILDYAILSDARRGDVHEVRLRAHVGTLPPQPNCAAAPPLDIAAWTAQATVAPDAPAWLQPVAAEAGQRLIAALEATGRVALRRMNAPPPANLAPRNLAFDYAALTGSADHRMAPADHLSLISRIEITRPRSGTGTRLELRATSRLIRPDGTEAASDSMVSSVALPRATPFATLDRLAAPNRAALAEALMEGLADQAKALVLAEACKPLTAQLQAGPDGTLVLPFGKRHGITPAHLAYTEGEATPYTLLQVVAVQDRSVTLRPIDPGRAIDDLVGAPARFARPAG